MGPSRRLVDTERGRAVYFAPDAARVPSWQRSAPLLTVFHAWLAARGVSLVHAGAVGRGSGGVLLVGRGGSGKSTTALACLRAGLGYASDDYAAVDLATAGAPRAHSLFATAKLHGDHARRFPDLAGAIANARDLEREKALFLLDGAGLGDRLLLEMPVRAILLPRVVAERPDSRLVPTTAAAALLALAPSTVLQLPGAGAAALRAMAALVRAVPCFVLELGSDLHAIPRPIEDLLARAPAEAPARAGG